MKFFHDKGYNERRFCTSWKMCPISHGSVKISCAVKLNYCFFYEFSKIVNDLWSVFIFICACAYQFIVVIWVSKRNFLTRENLWYPYMDGANSYSIVWPFKCHCTGRDDVGDSHFTSNHVYCKVTEYHVIL